MSRSGSRLTTLGRGSSIATSTGTWRSESWSYFRLLRMLMCRCSPRGFAVIMAEDVPSVPESVFPPGESNGFLFVKFNRTFLSSRFLVRPLLELHHLRRRQPQHNLEVDSLLLPLSMVNVSSAILSFLVVQPNSLLLVLCPCSANLSFSHFSIR